MLCDWITLKDHNSIRQLTTNTSDKATGLKPTKEIYRSDLCPGLKGLDGGKRYVESGIIPMTYFRQGSHGPKGEGEGPRGRWAERVGRQGSRSNDEGPRAERLMGGPIGRPIKGWGAEGLRGGWRAEGPKGKLVNTSLKHFACGALACIN